MNKNLRFVLSLPKLLWLMLVPTLKRRRTRALTYTGILDENESEILESDISVLSHFDLYLAWCCHDPGMIPPQGAMRARAWEYGKIVNADLLAPGMRVLDVGAGNSTFACFIAHQGASVITIDLPNPHARSLLYSGLQCRRYGIQRTYGSVLELPYPEESFNLVTCISVLEHFVRLGEMRLVEDCLEKAIQEMCRVTRRGGYIYLTIDVYVPESEMERTQGPTGQDALTLDQIHRVVLSTLRSRNVTPLSIGNVSDDWIINDLGDTGLSPHLCRPMCILAHRGSHPDRSNHEET